MNNMQQNTNLHIDLTLTDACNFRCKYCYEKDLNYQSRIMKKDIIQRLDSFIEEVFKKTKYKTIDLQFWGGEPTLCSSQIFSIVEKYKDDDRIFFSLITNGSLVHSFKDIFDKFKNYKINGKNKFITQISYDFEPVHSLNRVDTNNISTSELVYKNILWMAENQYDFSIKSTIRFDQLNLIHDVYLDYIQKYKEICDLHPKFQKGLFITPDTTYHGILPNRDQFLKEFRDKLIKIAIDYKKSGVPFLWFNMNRAVCTAGVDFISIDTDGSIYRCHGALYSKEKPNHFFGSIYEENIINKIINTFEKNFKYYSREPEECKTCYAQFCLRCNIHRSENSLKETIEERWTDYTNSPSQCDIYREISKVRKALEKMR